MVDALDEVVSSVALVPLRCWRCNGMGGGEGDDDTRRSRTNMKERYKPSTTTTIGGSDGDGVGDKFRTLATESASRAKRAAMTAGRGRSRASRGILALLASAGGMSSMAMGQSASEIAGSWCTSTGYQMFLALVLVVFGAVLVGIGAVIAMGGLATAASAVSDAASRLGGGALVYGIFAIPAVLFGLGVLAVGVTGVNVPIPSECLIGF